MKLKEFVSFLFLIIKSSLCLELGQKIDAEKPDCTKLYNFLKSSSYYYANDCCSYPNNRGLSCDYENYIISLNLSQ